MSRSKNAIWHHLSSSGKRGIAVPYAKLTNPQTLNLYSIVAADPESFADLDGHDSVFDNIIRMAGGTSRTQNETGVQMAVGAAKGLLNVAIDAGNAILTLRGGGFPGLTKPSSDAIPLIPLSNQAQALGALAGPPIVLSAVGGALEGGTTADAAMASRAQEIDGVQDPIAQNMRTTAVGTVTNADGTTQTLVSSSRATFTPAQRAALQPGETAVSGAGGVHEEQKILNAASANGQTPTAIAPSRPPCSTCAQNMQNANVRVVPPARKPPNP